ncbi:MAG TPA: aspartate kinase [Candidatus Pullichristensenella avicola]|nr:aspartate kinase [Candidatus Pullichristensenella avicola]
MIVCKFGGTSLCDASRVRQAMAILRRDGARRFVVVSAPGRRFDGDEKITDLLLRAGNGDDEALAAALARFREMAAALGVDMEGELRRVREEIPGRGAEFAASRGEYLCGHLLARCLRWTFVDAAEAVCLRQNGTADLEETYRRLSRLLRPLKNAVVPGFYGTTRRGEVRTFPRGGSDITGALVAGAMGARLYENWTDVDGLMSADPRVVQNTICVPEVSYRQMRLLSAMGAQVLHPDSLLPVMRADIPTALKNSFHPERPGTRISGGARAKVPCLAGRALESGAGLLAILSPEAMDLPNCAVSALRAAGIRPRWLGAWSDRLLMRVRANCLPDALRALHHALIEGGAKPRPQA